MKIRRYKRYKWAVKFFLRNPTWQLWETERGYYYVCESEPPFAGGTAHRMWAQECAERDALRLAKKICEQVAKLSPWLSLVKGGVFPTHV